MRVGVQEAWVNTLCTLQTPASAISRTNSRHSLKKQIVDCAKRLRTPHGKGGLSKHFSLILVAVGILASSVLLGIAQTATVKGQTHQV